MTPRTYSSPLRFKEALEQRLRNATQGGEAFARKRQLLVFDRFLARAVAELGDSVVLKGGLVLELRLHRARTTKDVDLRMLGLPDELLPRLQAAGRLDLGDFMVFEVGPNPDGGEIDNDGLRYEGLRFRAECRLAGKPYGQPFGVDVVFGEPMLGDPEERVADDVLGFAGVLPPRLRIYPIETHIAEKLHAFTMPRARPNTRVKDLPDIALLARAQPINARRLRQALEQTFTFRGTHGLPVTFPDPPAAWATPYAAMARADALPWPDLAAVTEAARGFLEPVLREELDAVWEPAEAVWQHR